MAVIRAPTPVASGLTPTGYDIIEERVTYRLAQCPGAYVIPKYIRPVIKRKATGLLSCPPAPVRNRDRLIGIKEPVLPRYERIAFEKALLTPPDQPPAAFMCPGHPLLDATLDLTLERHRDLLRRGTVLVDERDPHTSPRVLFYLEHAVQDASSTKSGERRTISKQMLYIELDAAGNARHLHYAPLSRLSSVAPY